MANNNLITSGKLPPGVLNTVIRERARETFALGGTDNLTDVIVKLIRLNFGPGFSLVNREFTAICIQVLDSSETQKLIASNPQIHFKNVTKTTSKYIPRACRVYIPEIHSDRALPKNILNPSKKDLSTIKAMFPVFFAQTEQLSNKGLFVGDRITVKIKNEIGGGIYVNRIENSFSVNPFNVGKTSDAASKAFRCEIIKSGKVISKNATEVAGKATITKDIEPQVTLSPEAKRQQYLKYLYETEVTNMKALKGYWDKTKMARALNDAVLEIKNDKSIKEDITDLKPLLWALTYQVSGFIPAGLAVGGNAVLSISAVKDHYGIHRISKKYFDTQKILLKKYDFFKNPNLKHSDLLDPKKSMRFFVIDFFHYLTTVSQLKISDVKTVGAITEKNEKIITKYFTNNKNRVDIIFPDSFAQMANDFNNAYSGSEPLEGEPTLEIDSFEDWSTKKMTGVPATVESSTPVASPEKNPQGPDPKKPPSTPDECHSNYPAYNDYAIHVNAQKKMVRQFVDSKISGQDLKFLNNEHKGVRTIKFAELDVPCPFKVVRYDGLSGFSKDPKRWFDKNNSSTSLLLNRERWGSSHYRARNQITHCTIQTLGDNLDERHFYKNTIHTMLALGRKIPHFIITPNGQIIQLVDMACAINSKSPVSLSSVNVGFAFGTGGQTPFTSKSPNVVKKNCVLIKEKNIYSCHKLGTKAALQSMQKLIKFFMTITKINYKLAAFDDKIASSDYNKSTIQSLGQLTGGIGGMNFIYYAWTYNFAFDLGGKNILNEEIFS